MHHLERSFTTYPGRGALLIKAYSIVVMQFYDIPGSGALLINASSRDAV